MSRQVKSVALAIAVACCASSVCPALADAAGPFGPQSTWILSDSVLDHNGEGVAEIVELHIDQVGNKFLSRRYASDGGVQSWLERDDAVFKFSDLNPRIYDKFVASLRPGEFTIPSQFTPYGEPVYGADDMVVELDEGIIQEMLFTYEKESKYNTCKKYTVPTVPKFYGANMQRVHVDEATGNVTYEISVDGAESSLSYTESADGQPIELGGLHVISYQRTVDTDVFIPHDACTEPVMMDAGVHRMETNSQPVVYRELEPLSAEELAHENWIQEQNKAMLEGYAAAELQAWSQNWPSQWQEGGIGNRVKGCLWAGYANEFSADKHHDNHDGYSNHCHGAPLYYTQNDQNDKIWYKWDSATVPDGRSRYNQFGVVNYDDVYPHPDFGVCITSSIKKSPTSRKQNCLPEQLRQHYATNSMSDAAWIASLELPHGSNRLTGQQISWCRAVPFWYYKDQQDYSDYMFWNHGLQATLNWSGSNADTDKTKLDSGDIETRQHDFCPLGMWTPVKSCSCDGVLFKRVNRPNIKFLFAGNDPLKKCKKLFLGCQRRNRVGICQAWSWEWRSVWLGKYWAAEETDWRIYSPAGRYDDPHENPRYDAEGYLDTSVCMALRLPGETFEGAAHLPAIGDGNCDSQYNYDLYGYDGGDCCKLTCVPTATGSCSTSDCKQPGCVQREPKTAPPGTGVAIATKPPTKPPVNDIGTDAPQVVLPAFCTPGPKWTPNSDGTIDWKWTKAGTDPVSTTTCPPGYSCVVPGNFCAEANQF